MIGKIPAKRKDGKSSFRALIEYCFGDRSRTPHTGSRCLSASPDEPERLPMLLLEMENLAVRNVRCHDPVFHFILSWNETELPTNEQADGAVEIALKELDLADCQALWALQTDTHNRHVHVVVNRIHPETFKAVQPAGNWTKKALERAARKIEVAQGWEVERSGRYTVTAGGEILEKKRTGEEEEIRLSQTARDVEAHTATRSAERTGQEVAAPLIRNARSWEELHAKLAERGILFERKGSGAVLKIGKTAIKASKAGRDVALSKLEQRLGAYRAAEATVEAAPAVPAPVERAARGKVRGSWEDYIKTRTEYYEGKKKLFSELKARHQAERLELIREQRENRARLFNVSWSGRGGELNRRRSVLAAVQESARLDRHDRQRREREELKKRMPRRFPNFKTWLDTGEQTPELLTLYRYIDMPVLLQAGEAGGADGSVSSGSLPQDIRSFRAVWGNKGGVAYCRKSGRADFVDYGRRIVLDRKCDEASVLAALQLANRRWGGAWIEGTEEYKRACVETAARHGLKLLNPELARQVTEGRRETIETGKTLKGTHSEQARPDRARPDLARREFERYADAVGAERYRVVAVEFTPEGTKAFVVDRKNGGLEGKTREQVADMTARLAVYARYGKNINVVPLSAGRHHLLIDDLTREKLQQLKADGYAPACVIESSPGNFQAVLTVPKGEKGGDADARVHDARVHDARVHDAGVRDVERDAANRLTRELNLRYGDPKLSGAVHAHRLPPFPNLKPKHRREDGSFPETALTEANGGICRRAEEELAGIRMRVKEETERQRRAGALRAPSPTEEIVSTGAVDPGGAYRAHFQDILSRFKDGDTDFSRVDAMIGVRMRVTGYSADQIKFALREEAPKARKAGLSAAEYDAKYRYRNWKQYAEETVKRFVFGSRGAEQYRKALEYRAWLMKLEGRSLAEERREARGQERQSSPGLGR